MMDLYIYCIYYIYNQKLRNAFVSQSFSFLKSMDFNFFPFKINASYVNLN